MLTPYSITNIYSYFEYKGSKRIKGEPTLDSILSLHQQVKRNAQDVLTTLSGGQLGYLALVISKDKYDAISNSTQFERSQDTGLFEVYLPTTTDLTTAIVQTPLAPTKHTTQSVTIATNLTL